MVVRLSGSMEIFTLITEIQELGSFRLFSLFFLDYGKLELKQFLNQKVRNDRYGPLLRVVNHIESTIYAKSARKLKHVIKIKRALMLAKEVAPSSAAEVEPKV